MNTLISKKVWLLASIVLLLFTLGWVTGAVVARESGGALPLSPAGGSGTRSFTYQGRLLEGEDPANGNYDFLVTIWDDSSLGEGNQIASFTGHENVPVENGTFILYMLPTPPVTMSDIFDGQDRWIQIEVSPAGAGTYTTLPRQPIAAVPYAWNLYPGAVITATGSIHSVAETKLAINPFDIEPTTEATSNLELSFYHHWSGYMEITNDSVADSKSVYIPVHNLTQLFGTPLRLKDLQVCYKLDTSSSFISQTFVYYVNTSGSRTPVMMDSIAHTSTNWECYTVVDESPTTIEGPMLVYFRLSFGGTGDSHNINIGQITATFVE